MKGGGLTLEKVKALREEYGWNEVRENKPNAVIIFLKKFWGPSAWMIEIIAIVSFFLHKRADFGIAIGLFLINAAISFLEERRAENTVQLLRIQARVLRDKEWQSVPHANVEFGN